MNLTTKQKKHLRKHAHSLKPVVMIGSNGLTQAVLDEIERSIEHHELIKVRVNASDNAERAEMVEKICNEIRCAEVFSIGHVVTLYRQGKYSKIKPSGD